MPLCTIFAQQKQERNLALHEKYGKERKHCFPTAYLLNTQNVPGRAANGLQLLHPPPQCLPGGKAFEP